MSFFPIHFSVQKHLLGYPNEGSRWWKKTRGECHRRRERDFSIWKSKHFSVDNGNKILRFFPMSLSLSLQKFNCLSSTTIYARKRNDKKKKKKKKRFSIETHSNDDGIRRPEWYTTEPTFLVFLSFFPFCLQRLISTGAINNSLCWHRAAEEFFNMSISLCSSASLRFEEKIVRKHDKKY